MELIKEERKVMLRVQLSVWRTLVPCTLVDAFCVLPLLTRSSEISLEVRTVLWLSIVLGTYKPGIAITAGDTEHKR